MKKQNQSHELFFTSILLALIMFLMSLFSCRSDKVLIDYNPVFYNEKIEWIGGRKMIIHEFDFDTTYQK